MNLDYMISIINMPGANAFVAPLQDPISHLILRAFQRKAATISEISEEEKQATLKDEIENFHTQLKYPFGKICMMERNAESDNFDRQYYAVKELSVIIEVIEDENFVRYLKETDENFANAWLMARSKIINWHKEILDYELLKSDVITSSTFNFFRAQLNDNNYIKRTTLSCVKAVKTAWQIIWYKFLDSKKSFAHITENRTNSFEYALTKNKPTLGHEKFFVLAINANNNIRLWANLEDGLFKARPTTRKLKWIKTDAVSTNITPVWWLYASELGNNYATFQSLKDKLIDQDDLSNNFSATTIY
jgi:hypothetical protein